MTFSKLGGDWLLHSVGDPPKNQYWLSYRCRTAAVRSRDGAVILLETDIYIADSHVHLHRPQPLPPPYHQPNHHLTKPKAIVIFNWDESHCITN